MVRFGLGIYKENKKLGIVSVKKTMKGLVVEHSRTVVVRESDSPSENPGAEVTGAVKEFLDFYKIKPGFVVFGLERNRVLWNIVETPPISKSELHQVLSYELELHVPTDPSTLYFDAMQEPNSTAAVASALLITAPRTLINQIMDSVRTIGLRLDCIEPAAVARWRLVRRVARARDESLFRTIVTFSGQDAELLFLKKGFPVLDRRIDNPAGKADLDHASDTDVETGGPTTVFMDRIIQEIKLAHINLGGSGSEDEIGDVWVMGDDAGRWTEGLNDRAESLTFSEVPFLSDEMASLSGCVELTAFGLISVMDNETETCINLVPENVRPVQRHIGLAITGVLSGLLLATLFLGGLNNFWRMELKLAQTKARIAGMEKEVDRILEINRRFNATKKQFEFFRSLNQDYPSLLDILRELTEILPAQDTEASKKVWLNSFVSREHTLTIKGESESPEELITILENSPYFEKVHFEGAVSGKKFTIKMDISKYPAVAEAMEETEKGPGKPNEAGGTPTAIPTTMRNETRGQSEKTAQEEREEVIPRGPAFPRQTRPPAENDSGNRDNAMGDTGTAPFDEEKQPIFPSPRGPDEEAVERMKQNLFDFIQKHREDGNVVDRDRSSMEEPDPEEAAANFLEFLKAAAEERRNEEPEQE